MAAARVDCAIEEHRRLPDSQILITGGWGEHFNSAPLPHAEYVKMALLARGVDPSAIRGCIPSANTVEDVWMSIQCLDDFDGPLVIITSEHHVDRARFIFECFFPPLRLRFLATPSFVPETELPGLYKHEAIRLDELRRQGGVIVEGRLYPWRSNE